MFVRLYRLQLSPQNRSSRFRVVANKDGDRDTGPEPLLREVAAPAVGCDGSLPPGRKIEVASYLNAAGESLRIPLQCILLRIEVLVAIKNDTAQNGFPEPVGDPAERAFYGECQKALETC